MGAFEPTDNQLGVSFAAHAGTTVAAVPPAAALFVGCNYAPVSRETFLKGAAEADAMVGKAAKGIVGAGTTHEEQKIGDANAGRDPRFALRA